MTVVWYEPTEGVRCQLTVDGGPAFPDLQDGP